MIKKLYHEGIMSQLPLILCVSIFLVSLSGCQIFRKPAVQLPVFQQKFIYKRLVINNTQEAWVLTNNLIENWPVKNNKVWFSSDKGIVRFTNERLTSYITVAPKRQWQVTVNKELDWQKLLTGNMMIFKRCVVDFPKHVDDNCTVYKAQLTQQTPSNNYVGQKKLLWVLVEPTSTPNTGNIWYAFEKGTQQPIYGQICLDKKTCMSWQNWSLTQ